MTSKRPRKKGKPTGEPKASAPAGAAPAGTTPASGMRRGSSVEIANIGPPGPALGSASRSRPSSAVHIGGDPAKIRSRPAAGPVPAETPTGYSIDRADKAKAEIDRRLQSASPTERLTADVNRRMIDVIELWLRGDGLTEAGGKPPLAVMSAVMHGVVTVCGTILVNTPLDARERASKIMRQQLDLLFERMVKACMEEPDPDPKRGSGEARRQGKTEG